jgi:hypothetical protein
MFENKNLNTIFIGITAISGLTFVLMNKSNINMFKKWFYNVWDDINVIKNDLNSLNNKFEELNKKVDGDVKKEQ